jgi:hypothetical protein
LLKAMDTRAFYLIEFIRSVISPLSCGLP